jgi:hypothetical protein
MGASRTVTWPRKYRLLRSQSFRGRSSPGARARFDRTTSGPSTGDRTLRKPEALLRGPSSPKAFQHNPINRVAGSHDLGGCVNSSRALGLTTSVAPSIRRERRVP